MIGFVLAAALLGASDYAADPDCSEDAARHVAANYSVCVWEPPPPFAPDVGSSDYRGRGAATTFLRRPDFEWRLRDLAIRQLDEIPSSDLGIEKDLFGGYVAACRAPDTVARLGEDIAGLRGDHAAECWQFLDEEEVRRSAPADAPEASSEDAPAE